MAQVSTPRPTKDVITEALLDITAERGLDQVSVRQVAAAAGVAIGTVQHYFPTKDAMLTAAFTEVVLRIRERVAATVLGPDVRRNLAAVLRELLPLDDHRTAEVRIQVAFAARAATSPALAEMQGVILRDVTDAIATAFTLAGHGTTTAERASVQAQVALATVDGLALHAVSSGDWLDAEAQTAALDHLLDALVRR
ncbi:TetR/AcrR family transcriptional regulator [Jiangella alkaliphila]|uniref:DNA-binding transcriptional regulator, AcrR family n=1 Tax=Jiangella alkaliphila TaxID=419479 RepID=A0A1H2JKA4_9ACTN|nr:TetR family transcriptional regulator C-terminal domain-containing protein [Jiangella alkaliphila]SDU56782.1 DNA-binding transcriptional regulator, AcrR family [Jiangella alkaliphila]